MRRIIKRDLELVKFKNRCQIKRYFITREKNISLHGEEEI